MVGPAAHARPLEVLPLGAPGLYPESQNLMQPAAPWPWPQLPPAGTRGLHQQGLAASSIWSRDLSSPCRAVAVLTALLGASRPNQCCRLARVTKGLCLPEGAGRKPDYGLWASEHGLAVPQVLNQVACGEDGMGCFSFRQACVARDRDCSAWTVARSQPYSEGPAPPWGMHCLGVGSREWAVSRMTSGPLGWGKGG